jgi:DMSO/TMAO reductase YedYZ heme-binding membrane subunit
MKKFLSQLFNDKNTINEKSFIGFCAFLMMVVFAIADIITGSLGKELVIQDFIFNSFLWMTLGCFGIASVDKFINKKNETNNEEQL